MDLTANEVKLFAVYTNSDLTEGRGSEYVLYFCRTRSTAVRLSKKNYIMGTDCPIREITGYEIDHKIYLNGVRIQEPNDEDLKNETAARAKQKAIEAKEAALAKAKLLGLSDEDIKALSTDVC